MSEDPEFRTVLRGFDPDQVRSSLTEMQNALSTARRTAADRTIELTRMQDKYAQLERDLDEAVHRIADLESRAGQSNASADVGARIGSILALANEEAEELRANGRQQAQREREEASAAIAASRAEVERYADGVRSNANSQAGQIIDDARRAAGEILAHARDDAEQRRAEARAIVESHQAQADAVAQFGGQIAHHADRLRLATARVEQLAQEEATLIERQSQDGADRIQRDKEHQLAAVDARRDSIKAQLTTVGALLQELGGAVGAPPESLEGSIRATHADQAVVDEGGGSDLVETTELAFDRADEAAGVGQTPVTTENRTSTDPATQPRPDPPQGHTPQGQEPQGHEPQGHEPQGHEPQDHEPLGHEPQGHEPQAAADQEDGWSHDAADEGGAEDVDAEVTEPRQEAGARP
jgi:hypothetical protein